jgi:hypothetical protein
VIGMCRGVSWCVKDWIEPLLRDFQGLGRTPRASRFEYRDSKMAMVYLKGVRSKDSAQKVNRRAVL